MKKHTKIYFKAFKVNFDPVSGWHDCVSEMDNKTPSNDIHHIIGRGKGGEDRIENLMALTREEHQFYGDKVKYMQILLDIHEGELMSRGIPYDTQYMDTIRKRYEN